MYGGTYHARLALGWGKTLYVKRDGFCILITQQLSKKTYKYIEKKQVLPNGMTLMSTNLGNTNRSPTYAYLGASELISTSPELKLIQLFSIMGKDKVTRYYGKFETKVLDSIYSVNKMNQIANGYKAIITNYNKEHKNERSNK